MEGTPAMAGSLELDGPKSLHKDPITYHPYLPTLEGIEAWNPKMNLWTVYTSCIPDLVSGVTPACTKELSFNIVLEN